MIAVTLLRDLLMRALGVPAGSPIASPLCGSKNATQGTSRNAWDHLPNAKLIDQVLSDLKANPEVFARAWNAVGTPRYAPWDAAWEVAGDAGHHAAWATVSAVAGDEMQDVAWDATWSAILAFIAYDDSGKYLDMPYEKLKTWAELSEEPAAMLLLPYIWAKEQISPKIYA